VRLPAGKLRYDNPTSRAIVAALAGSPRPLADISREVGLPAQNVLANALVLSAALALRPVERTSTTVANLNQAIYLGLAHRTRFGSSPCLAAQPYEWMMACCL
jgi:hypothetical protein